VPEADPEERHLRAVDLADQRLGAEHPIGALGHAAAGSGDDEAVGVAGPWQRNVHVADVVLLPRATPHLLRLATDPRKELATASCDRRCGVTRAEDEKLHESEFYTMPHPRTEWIIEVP